MPAEIELENPESPSIERCRQLRQAVPRSAHLDSVAEDEGGHSLTSTQMPAVQRHVSAPRQEPDALELCPVVRRAVLKLGLPHPRHAGRYQVRHEQVERDESEKGYCERGEYQGGNSFMETGKVFVEMFRPRRLYSSSPLSAPRGVCIYP